MSWKDIHNAHVLVTFRYTLEGPNLNHYKAPKPKSLGLNNIDRVRTHALTLPVQM